MKCLNVCISKPFSAAPKQDLPLALVNIKAHSFQDLIFGLKDSELAADHFRANDMACRDDAASDPIMSGAEFYINMKIIFFRRFYSFLYFLMPYVNFDEIYSILYLSAEALVAIRKMMVYPFVGLDTSFTQEMASEDANALSE